MSLADELIRPGAAPVADLDLLARRALRPGELVAAAIARIEATDAMLNALPTRCFERAREQAERIDRGAAPAGLLGGMPIVVKHNNDVGRACTSRGSAIFGATVAPCSDRTVARLGQQGALRLAKSKLSERGGANTTNRVFGSIRNAPNPRLTCGGSSGGSAVAVASRQVWLVHGSDVGGSLRVPPRSEAALLAFGAWIERELGGAARPVDPRLNRQGTAEQNCRNRGADPANRWFLCPRAVTQSLQHP